MGSIGKIQGANYREYLEGFPEEIYDLSDTSHIVRFADALCDAGVGYMRKQNLLNRIQTSLHETTGNTLDSFYGELFGLTRLPHEQYINPAQKSNQNKDGEPFTDTGLVNSEQQDIVLNCDAHYRARIWKYMSSLPMSGTRAGIRQAAEAALDCTCWVLEAKDFYASNAVEEDNKITMTIEEKDEQDSSKVVAKQVLIPERLITYLNHNQEGDGRYTARYDCILIIAEAERPQLTPEQRSYANVALRRLIPQDVTPIFLTKDEAVEIFALEPEQEEKFSPLSAAASSRWWHRVKYVTGAEDWSYEYDPDKSFWVEPNVRKQAPILTDYQSQEFVMDYTYMTSEITASSEHIGDYNACQTDFYRVYLTDWGKAEHSASDALSSAVNKNFATSLSDSSLQVIDDSYPIDYLPAVLPRYHEDSRARRMWSSEERKTETESIEFTFDKPTPLNRILFNTFSKPIRIAVEGLVDGEWSSLTIDDSPISFTSDAWGGSSIAGDMINVTFDFDTVVVRALRFTFTRLQEQRYIDNGDGTRRIEEMVYSVEMADATFLYRCLNEADFIASSYSDCFGNLVETELEAYEAMNVIDSTDKMWISKPNPTPYAVEYLILDIRDANRSPQVVDYIDIDAVYSGATMKIYSSYEDEWGGHVWYPYPGIHTLRDGRIVLEERKASFIKLEFTNLSTIPYRIVDSNIKTTYLTYPPEARQAQDNSENTFSTTHLEQLLNTSRGANASTVAATNRYLKTGTSNIYSVLKTQEDIAAQLADSESLNPSESTLWSIDEYRSVYGLGLGTKKEYPLGFNTNPPSWSLDNTPTYSYFASEQEHFYINNTADMKQDVAYVVGIRSISFGREEHSTLYESDGVFFARTTDKRFTRNAYNFEEDGNGLSPVGDKVSVYESRDFDTTCLFDSFDFAVSQKEPRQVFARPERMAYKDDPEWTSLRYEDEYQLEEAEMGSSGTVARLARQGGATEGIESKNYLVHADGMAEFHVRVYDYGKKGEKATWHVQAMEGTQELYNMAYEVERGGWHTLNSHFQLVPAGGWWNHDFQYRCQLLITADRDLPAGTSVFFPGLDMLSTSWLPGGGETGARVRPDLSDLRVVYYSGMKNEEIDCAVTGNGELWFALQEDLKAGETADGSYNTSTHLLRGCYYLYYYADADKDIVTTEAGQPCRNVDKIFDLHVQEDKYVDDEGLCVFSQDTGYVSFDLIPSQEIKINDSTTHANLFTWENETGSFKVDMHFYQDTLVFEVFDGNFRSSASGSLRDGEIADGKKVRILGQYDKPGTADHGEQKTQARAMEIWIGNENYYRKLVDTKNIYDLVEYDSEKYRFEDDSPAIISSE